MEKNNFVKFLLKMKNYNGLFDTEMPLELKF